MCLARRNRSGVHSRPTMSCPARRGAVVLIAIEPAAASLTMGERRSPQEQQTAAEEHAVALWGQPTLAVLAAERCGDPVPQLALVEVDDAGPGKASAPLWGYRPPRRRGPCRSLRWGPRVEA